MHLTSSKLNNACTHTFLRTHTFSRSLEPAQAHSRDVVHVYRRCMHVYSRSILIYQAFSACACIYVRDLMCVCTVCILYCLHPISSHVHIAFSTLNFPKMTTRNLETYRNMCVCVRACVCVCVCVCVCMQS